MAPRNSRPSGTQAGRESKSSTLNSKPSSRGGIQKRRTGPTKTDNDGDLVMDAAARRPTRSSTRDPAGTKPNPTAARTAAPASRGNTRGASKAAQTIVKHLKGNDGPDLASRVSNVANGKGAKGPSRNEPWVFLRVHGLKQSKAATNAGGGRTDLIGFLERKASTLSTSTRKRPVIIKQSYMVGDYVFISATKADAEELIKVNGFTFAGAPLEIIESEDGPPDYARPAELAETTELRGILQEILSKRYNATAKLLVLSSLAEDPALVNLGMFETRERAIKTFKGLMAICDGLFKTEKAKQEAIESISLAGNNIDNVTQVEGVAVTFPRLKNLDLSNNQIASIKGLERWKGKFNHLETIYVAQNPIEAAEPNYAQTLLEWYPKLQNVNGTQLRTPEQIAAREEALKPKPIPQSGPDFRDVNGIGESFLLEFFSAYDGDRQGLLAKLYDDASQFSLSIDTRSVRDSNAPPPLPWSAYIKSSRNLTRITTISARKQRLSRGVRDIFEVWKSLPFTRHPDIKADLSKYIMDCHPLTGLADPTGQNPVGVDGMIICVHGEYEEADQASGQQGKRSFSRTFVLGPGQPGKGAIRVISDMLSLRAHSALPDVHQETKPAAAPADQNQAMVAELCKRTGMTPKYSEMCLSQVAWDFDKALVAFSENRAQLPAEAFANGVVPT